MIGVPSLLEFDLVAMVYNERSHSDQISRRGKASEWSEKGKVNYSFEVGDDLRSMRKNHY